MVSTDTTLVPIDTPPNEFHISQQTAPKNDISSQLLSSPQLWTPFYNLSYQMSLI